jgi:hypothetical protein
MRRRLLLIASLPAVVGGFAGVLLAGATQPADRSPVGTVPPTNPSLDGPVPLRDKVAAYLKLSDLALTLTDRDLALAQRSWCTEAATSRLVDATVASAQAQRRLYPGISARSVIVALRIEPAQSDEQVSSAWVASVSWAPGLEPRVTWRTVEVLWRLEAGRWLVDDEWVTPGPTPRTEAGRPATGADLADLLGAGSG